MTHSDEKIDQSYSRRRIEFQSKSDYQAFCRVAPDGIPATHKFVIRHIQRTPEELKKNPALLPSVEMGCVPKGIRDVADETNQFQDLNVQQLTWLLETYGITQDPPVPGEAVKKTDEKSALVAALRKHLESNIKAAPKADKPAPVIIPPEVAAMSEADMETLAATLGVHAEFKKLKGRPVAERRMLIAKAKLAKVEKAEPANA